MRSQERSFIKAEKIIEFIELENFESFVEKIGGVWRFRAYQLADCNPVQGEEIWRDSKPEHIAIAMGVRYFTNKKAEELAKKEK